MVSKPKINTENSTKRKTNFKYVSILIATHQKRDTFTTIFFKNFGVFEALYFSEKHGIIIAVDSLRIL